MVALKATYLTVHWMLCEIMLCFPQIPSTYVIWCPGWDTGSGSWYYFFIPKTPNNNISHGCKYMFPQTYHLYWHLCRVFATLHCALQGQGVVRFSFFVSLSTHLCLQLLSNPRAALSDGCSLRHLSLYLCFALCLLFVLFWNNLCNNLCYGLFNEE